MRGVTIPSGSEVEMPGVGLRVLLECVRDLTWGLQWQVADVEATGLSSRVLEELDTRNDVASAELLESLAGVEQIIEGCFMGRHPGAPSPCMVVLAVDGEAFDVYASDERILARLRTCFSTAAELPEEWGG